MKIEQRLLGGNFLRGRNGHKIRAIVIHIQEGYMEGTDAHFRDPESDVSAHYGVSKQGNIIQWVLDQDTAWHCGRVSQPTAQLFHELGGNPNDWTIGIECEGFARDVPTEVLMDSLVTLVGELVKRYNIPPDRKHILGHREFRHDKTCPGKIDVDEVVRRLRSKPQPGDRVYSEFFKEHLILTRYESDEEWYFIRESMLRAVGKRADTPWSEMPAPKK